MNRSSERNVEKDDQLPESDSSLVALIAERAARVRERIAQAAARAGRRGGDVTLVAVTKTHPAGVVRAAQSAGLRVFGENRVQEALGKLGEVPPPVEWHLIGHLQTNKAREVVGRFELIHSIDSVKLVEELERRAAAAGVTQRVLLQVNVSGEGSKSGVGPERLGELIEKLSEAPHLRAEGLMTIPPYDEDPEASRPFFRRLREIAEGLKAEGYFAGINTVQLSMGMSGDFEVAIEEGATLVRVGSALLGPR